MRDLASLDSLSLRDPSLEDEGHPDVQPWQTPAPRPSWKARVFALYLPQYHPIPENDAWWGPGFTEWTNVAKARPLFRGHRQPRLPGELGFYDLRLPEARNAQANLAREHGVEGFIYWHYWFAGRRLLDRPFREVLASGEPDFPFCIGWANHSWTKICSGLDDRQLVEQTYPGQSDIEAHFDALLPAFEDRRYLRVDGAPFLYVFGPGGIPEPQAYWARWRELAIRRGIGDLHLVGIARPPLDAASLGLDGIVPNWLPGRRQPSFWRRVLGHAFPEIRERLHKPTLYSYDWYARRSISDTIGKTEKGWEYGWLLPNWDNTPRTGRRGFVLRGSTPERFRNCVHRLVTLLDRNEVPSEHRIIVLKSWNEWAEGNYVEPDQEFGRGYLEALRDELSR